MRPSTPEDFGMDRSFIQKKVSKGVTREPRTRVHKKEAGHAEGNCMLCGNGTFNHSLSCPVTIFEREMRINPRQDAEALSREILGRAKEQANAG